VKSLPASKTKRLTAAALTESLLFEACERRLVLSAQLLFDVLGDQALHMHASQSQPLETPLELHGAADFHPNTCTSPNSPPPSATSVPVGTQLSDAHAATGWNDVQQQFGLTGKGQTVAVIDSGIAWDHVALGRGYGPGYRVVGGWDFTEENDAFPYDDGPMGFHGTHVAGIVGSDDPAHSGVSPDVDLVSLRVFNDLGQGQLSWVERALQWVHEHRNSFEHPITTVNLSLGTTWNADTLPSWASLEEELQLLLQDGIVVTASAGNSFEQYDAPGLSYPAASPYVLPVASVDDDGTLSDFSQRSARVLAAPGSNIVSTVPDHVLGRDGRIDDFSAASGTSMAAPYVAGASVLVRQAMEMVGIQSITSSSIIEHLHTTADSIFDPLTSMSYDRLNLENAIDSLLPDDTIGNTSAAASSLASLASPLDGWLNYLGDSDAYRFTATASGALQLDANSSWLDTLQWSLQSAGQQLSSGGLEHQTVELIAGQTYELLVSANNQIGPFSIDLSFSPSGQGEAGSPPTPVPPPSVGPITELGTVQYAEYTLSAGSQLKVQAASTGIFSVQWANPDQLAGSLEVAMPSGQLSTDSTWSDGLLRVDVTVAAGDWLDIRLPVTSASGDQGELALANVLNRTHQNLVVTGTVEQDSIRVDLRDGLQITFGDIAYSFDATEINRLTIDGHANNDQIQIVGSAQVDKVDLRPLGSSLTNGQVEMTLTSLEQISYVSGGGADQVYLYDSDTDDILTARPRSAELVGVGYRFDVAQVERIYVHATGYGDDRAFLYDSPGNDRLVLRPQFSSLSGDGYFNFVRGFERVDAFANAGGFDEANLYDSAGDDRFNTNGATASIVGPGFSSFTRSFELVNGYANAGGSDRATLYGANSQTQWQQGTDFISFREGDWSREARGFEVIDTFVAGIPRTSDYADTLAAGSASTQHLRLDLNTVHTIDSRDPLVDLLPELNLLQDTSELSSWLTSRPMEEKIESLAQTWVEDPDHELSILDAIFEQLGQLPATQV
jgi:subtilisin family serine protease